MVAIIDNQKQKIDELCSEYRVKRLELFGSAADGTFDPKRSDFDFLVDFDRMPAKNAFHQYFDFLFALEELLGRRVDLVDLTAMQLENNKYFIASVNQSRQVLYGE